MVFGLARRFSPRSAAVLAAILASIGVSLAGALTVAAPARAQDDWGASYVTPFPENDVYRLQVIGDSMADGLFSALSEAFRSDSRLKMPNRQHVLGGLIRMDQDDFAKFEEKIKDEPPHIAVIMLGTADRVPLRAPDGRRVSVGSEEWQGEYGRRVDRIARALKRHGAAVYWVGLPIVRRSDMNEDVRMLNDVLRERALLNNFKFVSVYEAFADEAGQYTEYGPDLTGKQRLMRGRDGVSFSWVGYRKLAHFVEREIKRDVGQAKNDRNIPLAGAEAEQRRISPKAPETGWSGTVTAAPKEAAEPSTKGADAGPARNAGGSSGELKAENSKVSVKIPGSAGREEAVTIEILRPAIPASVVALVSRTQSSDRPAQLGDLVADTISGGTTVLNSITPGLASGSQAQRRRLAPTQSPFFRVLVKGERIPPKPGRADDFRWPPPDAVDQAPEPTRSIPGPPRAPKG